jgi:hypothetical protein
MGDSGEGLIDAEGRIQERIEEMQASRAESAKEPPRNPERTRQIESLKLARKETVRQLETTQHEARKSQLKVAIDALDRRIADMET